MYTSDICKNSTGRILEGGGHFDHCRPVYSGPWNLELKSTVLSEYFECVGKRSIRVFQQSFVYKCMHRLI